MDASPADPGAGPPWLHGVELDAGSKPTDNAFAESFDGRFREESRPRYYDSIALNRFLVHLSNKSNLVWRPGIQRGEETMRQTAEKSDSSLSSSESLLADVVTPDFEPDVKSKILEAIKKEVISPNAVRHNKVVFDKSDE